MEICTCPSHPNLFCLLKTGLKPGPSQGHSFYICTKCSFFKPTELKALSCPSHPAFTVEVQSLVKDDKKGILRCFFRCAGRNEGQTWCGDVPKNLKSKPKTDMRDKVSNGIGSKTDWVDCKESNKATSAKLKTDGSGVHPPTVLSHPPKSVVPQAKGVLTEKNAPKSVPQAKGVLTEKNAPKSKPSASGPQSPCDMSVICISDSDEEEKEPETFSKGKKSASAATTSATDVNATKSDSGMSFGSLSKSSRGTVSSCSSDMDVSFASQSFQQYRESPAKPMRPNMSKSALRKVVESDSESSSDESEPEEKHVVKELQNMSISMDEQVPELKKAVSPRHIKPGACARVEKDKVTESVPHHAPPGVKVESKLAIEKKELHQRTRDEEESSFPVKVERSVADGGAKQRPAMEHETSASLLVKRRELYAELLKLESNMRTINVSALPDKGQRLMDKTKTLKQAINLFDEKIKHLRSQEETTKSHRYDGIAVKRNDYDSTALNRPALKDVNVQSHQRFTAANMIPRPPTPIAKSYHQSSSQPPITNHLVRGQQQPQHYHQVDRGMDHLVFSQLPLHLQRMYADNPQALTLYGGRMTAQRLREVGSITTDALDKLHKQLETCPNEEVVTSDPEGLLVTLKPHQKQALAWLAWREKQQPSGGILADDMGLGKTLTTIAHVMQQKQKQTAEEKAKDTEKDKWLSRDKTVSKLDNAVKKTKATLIIAPASVVHQWAKEIERRCKPGRLKFLVYHGPNRERNIHRLIDNDIVLTTYTIVSKEVGVDKTANAEGPATDPDEDPRSDIMKDDTPYDLPMLLKIGWERVVLDEAHNIKNHKSLMSMSICRLRAAYRWALTGTPIQNDLLDMYSLLRFLRFSPFDEYKVWKRQLDTGKGETKRLNTIVQALLLRRTKDQTCSQGKKLVELPSKTIQTVEVKLGPEERTVYEKLFRKTQSTVRAYVNRHEAGVQPNKPNGSGSGGGSSHSNASGSQPGDGGAASGVNGGQSRPGTRTPAQKTGSQILVLLLRLRQCCSHLSLMRDHLETESLESDGIELSLEEQMKGMLLEEIAKDGDPAIASLAESKLFHKAGTSTKLKCVMDKMLAITSETVGDKCVVVSQWTRMLDVVAHHLGKQGISYAVIQGNIPAKKRMELVEEFNLNPKGPKVMLVSLRAGGVGLNLIGGNHLFLLDSHWNPALEEQACDRIYRMGQTKEVNIYRFLCKDTIEEKILSLQTRKLSLAKSVLTGADSKTEKLSLNDLRLIFGV